MDFDLSDVGKDGLAALKGKAPTRNDARNWVMFRWSLETNASATEIAHMSALDLEHTYKVSDLVGPYGEFVGVCLGGKCCAEQARVVSLDLLLLTLNHLWFDADRYGIIHSSPDRCIRNDLVFLSESGGPLAERTRSRLIATFFDVADIKGASISRLRHAVMSGDPADWMRRLLRSVFPDGRVGQDFEDRFEAQLRNTLTVLEMERLGVLQFA